METINILWTGGWDSTYRILQLATKNVIIQPYYLKDNRKSENLELGAISKITNQIRKDPETKCTIQELITMDVLDIYKNHEITNAYYNILKNNYFGSQYDWLARFATSVENLELTIHQDDKAFLIIKKYGDIKKRYSELKGEYYVLDHEASSIDLIKVFGKYHFPLLNHTKLDMKKDSEENNLIDIMNQTWFCHNPINNKPCGICNPCIYTIEEGLEYRFNNSEIRKYHVYKYIIPLKKSFILRGIFRGFKKLYKILRNK